MGTGKLAPSVEKPVRRRQFALLVALLLAIAIGLIVLLVRNPGDRPPSRAVRTMDTLKARCTPLEVETTIRSADIPEYMHPDCYALAGNVQRARELFAGMPPEDRREAVRLLFQIAHPIADAGDDRSAGPIMHLVVELSPDNYMATFHAGMADYALGNDAAAKPMLERFLTMYEPQDVWHDRAVQALHGIEAHQPLEQREAHFAE